MMEIPRNVEGACRLCLRGEGKISILEDDSNAGTVTAENIYNCVAVKISKDDKFPKGVCEVCVQSVASWCSFKNTCDETQKTFQKWLSCDKLPELPGEESISTSKEDIKSSSCNTYKINSNGIGIEKTDVPTLPKLPLDFSHLENGELPDVYPEIEETLSPENNEERNACIPETSINDALHLESLPSAGDNSSSLQESHCFSLDTSNPPQSKKSLDVNVVNSNLSVHSVNMKQNTDLECKYKVNESTSMKNDVAFNASGGIIDTSNKLKECLVNKPLAAGECPSLITDESHHNLIQSTDNDMALNSQNEEKSNENHLANFDCASKPNVSKLVQYQDKNNAEINTVNQLENKSSGNSNIIENTTEEIETFSEMEVDADKENSAPRLAHFRGLTNDDGEPIEGSGDSHAHLRIIATSTLADAVFDEQSNGTINQTESTDKVVKEATTSGDDNKEESLSQNVGDSILEKPNSSSNEEHGDDAGAASEEQPSIPPDSPVKDKQHDESNDPQSSTPHSDNHEAPSSLQEPNSTSQELQENLNSRTETPSMTTAVNIKQEPMDPEDEAAPINHFNIRVKSEFSHFQCEEETVDYENMDTGNDGALSTSTVSRNGGANTECHVCNRRYSTVNNYSKHLLTKIHLQNVKQSESSMQEGGEQDASSRDSPMLRYRLSGEQLQTSIEEPPSSQSSPYLPSTSSYSRRKIEYCELCNTSFGYISELKRHVQSKKHKEYERLVKEALPAEKQESFTHSHALSETRFIFLCPIEKCYFSSTVSGDLLDHIKVHGMSDCEEAKPEEESSPKPKLSIRQQELLRKEAEKRKIAEEQQRQQQQLQQQQFQQLQQQQLKHLQQQHLQQQKLQFLHKQKLQQQQHFRIQQQQQFRMQQQRMQQQQQRLQLQIQQQQLQYQMQFDQDIAGVDYSEDFKPNTYKEDYECEGCHKSFLRQSGLTKHSYYCQALKSSEPSNENKFQPEKEENENDQKLHCPLCDISFASKSVFVSHVQIYHKGSNLENGLFKINKKPPVMPVNSLSRISSKKGLGFVCNICGKKFSLLTSLNIHMKSHTASVKHICRICKEGFTSRKAFMEHCRLHFLKPGSKETLCHKCFKVFKTRSELYLHRKSDMCSIKMKIFSCNSCEHSFKEASALEEHKVRCHSESIDMADDEMIVTPSIGELYDDSFIPMNPIALLQTTDENLPGTSAATSSPNKNIQNYSNLQSSNAGMSFNISNSEELNDDTNYVNFNSKTPQKTPFHCEICSTYYCSKQTLKKHIKKYHILNTPYIGSKRYTTLKNSIQGGNSKLWKCKHCKTGFKTRKLLVLHLKKCQYNDLDLATGMCLQCGRWCESGKSRICRFCLPDFTKVSKAMVKRSVEMTKFKDFQAYKPNIKQEFSSIKYPETSNEDGSMNFFSNIPSFVNQLNRKIDRPPVRIKTERLDIASSSASFDPSLNIANTQMPHSSIAGHKPTSKEENAWQTSDKTSLMKCPIGEKYFRNEMTMIKHYSQCDGSCENRCSRCRKLFYNPQDYEVHLARSTCLHPRKRSTSKMRYPSFGSKKKYTRNPMRFVNNLAQKAELNIKSEMVSTSDHVNSLDENLDATPGLTTPGSISERTLDSTNYDSFISEESGMYQDSGFVSPANLEAQEKSKKLGRICTLCDKVILMQRGVYRHVYGCFKVFMQSQESVSCKKCGKTFSKLNSMKDNTAAMRQHVLECHFIPYFVGQGISEDGSQLDTPPPLLCYVCSFGFTDSIALQRHIKEHRNNKDEVNNVVLQLEDALLSDERLADEQSMFSLHVDIKNVENLCTVRTGRKLILKESLPGSRPFPVRKIFQCDKCSRSYTNRNKYLKHKKVHGIVKKSVLHEATANINEFFQGMTDVTSINNSS